jgi:phenylpyruvate tautomerase PptA (4-oxalocrotonate tautomerase family)
MSHVPLAFLFLGALTPLYVVAVLWDRRDKNLRIRRQHQANRPRQASSEEPSAAYRQDPTRMLSKLTLINEEHCMPLVRIDLPQSVDADTAGRIGEAVNKALMEVISVPKGDKFQVITRHPPEGLNLTPEYLGIRYSEKLILIQITLNHGRTSELKKALYRRVADDLAELGLRKQDVFINLVEVPKENWSFGNGEMQYGPQ